MKQGAYPNPYDIDCVCLHFGLRHIFVFTLCLHFVRLFHFRCGTVRLIKMCGDNSRSGGGHNREHTPRTHEEKVGRDLLKRRSDSNTTSAKLTDLVISENPPPGKKCTNLVRTRE